ncbi:hypothetical protein QOT17_022193 [Balamuthia mandrillaris]
MIHSPTSCWCLHEQWLTEPRNSWPEEEPPQWLFNARASSVPPSNNYGNHISEAEEGNEVEALETLLDLLASAPEESFLLPTAQTTPQQPTTMTTWEEGSLLVDASTSFFAREERPWQWQSDPVSTSSSSFFPVASSSSSPFSVALSSYREEEPAILNGSSALGSGLKYIKPPAKRGSRKLEQRKQGGHHNNHNAKNRHCKAKKRQRRDVPVQNEHAFP